MVDAAASVRWRTVGWAGGSGTTPPPPTSDQRSPVVACQVIGARSPDEGYG